MLHNSSPKYVFFGTPEFAAIILKKLIQAGFLPAAVVCNPDRPVGRKRIIAPPPTKLEIRNEKLENRVEVLQPENLSSLISHLSSLEPDFAVVAAYAKILSKEIIGLPRLGTIGVHPSLLPKYRGATPIQTAILDGATETGVTLFLMDEKVDHGEVIAKRKAQIANRNYKELEKNLAELGGNLLVETLPKFVSGKIKSQTQNENEATYTKKFATEDGYVSLEKDDPVIIERKIRALNPEPGVYTINKAGKRTKLLEAEFNKKEKLEIKKIQVEGKKPIFLTKPLLF